MDTGNAEIQLRRFTLQRQRFESRLRFFAHCVADITDDFHKQYGQFCADWEATEEACQQYITATEDYLRTRDIIVMEFKLLLGAIAVAETEYAIKKARKRFVELMEVCQANDQTTLQEIDDDIANVRLVYQMIQAAEYDQEE